MATASDTYERQMIPERTVYLPTLPMERFIVPLLRECIEGALADHAGSPGPGRNLKALDMGCGGQPFRTRLERMGYVYTGVDASQNPEGSVAVVCAVDEKLPSELEALGPFGLILCTEVMEHVADWAMAFHNLSSLLDEGGVIIMTCPFVYPLHEQPYDFFRPTVHALEYFARRTGLRMIERRAEGDAWDVLGTLLGCAWFEPRDKSIASRLVSMSGNAIRRLLFRLLCSKALRRHVGFQNCTHPFYLSNVAVLGRA